MAARLRSRPVLTALEGRDTPSVAVRADVTGDGTPDLITAPGAGAAPTVKVFDGATGAEIASFDAYEPTFTGGVSVAAADLDGDGRAEVITGADLGGGPRVRVLDGASVAAGDPVAVIDYLAFDDENFRGGVRVAAGDVTGDGVADLVVGAGEGGGPRVAGFDGLALGRGELSRPFTDFFSHESGLRNGVRVSVEDVTGDGMGDVVFGATLRDGVPDRYVNGFFLQNMGGDDTPWAGVNEYFAYDLATPVYDAAGNKLVELIPGPRSSLPVGTSGANPPNNPDPAGEVMPADPIPVL